MIIHWRYWGVVVSHTISRCKRAVLSLSPIRKPVPFGTRWRSLADGGSSRVSAYAYNHLNVVCLGLQPVPRIGSHINGRISPAALCLTALPNLNLRAVVYDNCIPVPVRIAVRSLSSVQLAKSSEGYDFRLPECTGFAVPKSTDFHREWCCIVFPLASHFPEPFISLILGRSAASCNELLSLVHQSFTFVHRSFVLIVRLVQSVSRLPGHSMSSDTKSVSS